MNEAKNFSAHVHVSRIEIDYSMFSILCYAVDVRVFSPNRMMLLELTSSLPHPSELMGKHAFKPRKPDKNDSAFINSVSFFELRELHYTRDRL